MSISEPIVNIDCDGPGCLDSIQAYMTPLARGSFDLRSLPSQIEREGWIEVNGFHFCPECQEEDLCSMCGMEFDANVEHHGKDSSPAMGKIKKHAYTPLP